MQALTIPRTFVAMQDPTLYPSTFFLASGFRAPLGERPMGDLILLTLQRLSGIGSLMIAYRIIDVGILIKMFKEKKNYLSSPQNWQDRWEKLDIQFLSTKRTNDFKRIRKRIFAQCWSTESYSWALWKMNSPHGYGVRIKTRTEKVYASLPSEVRDRYCEAKIIKKVEYFKEEEIQDRIERMQKVDTASVIRMFFLKRRAFEYEKEARLILPRLSSFSRFELETLGERSYLSYPCDPCKYLESIYFDSNIDPYVYDVFESIFRDFGFQGAIDKSGIDKKPDKIRINR
jgi:hypothetical protein